MSAILTNEEFEAVQLLLSDQKWRLNHLYWIVDKNGAMQRFRMNWAQERLFDGMHTRNNVLKARQLGISTFTAILILDSCMFFPNYTAGIVDRTGPEAKKKLAKIKFAFDYLDYLPENPTEEERSLAAIGGWMKEEMKGAAIGTVEARFPNGSTIYAGASLRGGTHQLLHISELGSVAAHNPLKAEETMTGSMNSVATDGVIIMESTHEGGQYGLNYRLVTEAMDLVGKELTPLDFKFWFFSWVEQAEYSLPGAKFDGMTELAKYFKSLETDYGIVLDEGQKAWYAAMSRTQGAKMRQEYPTVPDEALNPIADGTIYGSQINRLREMGRLTAEFEADPYRPVYAVFDKGMADFMSVWWVQPGADGKFYILDNYTANGLGIEHYIAELRTRDSLYGRVKDVVLPHDGVQRDYNGVRFFEKIEQAGYSTILVKRTSDIWASIDSTRMLLRHAVIHARCSQKTLLPDMKEGYISGVDALSNYKTAPPGRNGVMRNEPLHDVCSHACDSLRTFADAWANGMIAKESGWRDDDAPRGRFSGLARGVESLYH
ncbi:hypothetical protein ICN84_07895 [Akkermansia glycaniphila]|uniref:hypothetical protein n=1 Tax=Akkermansia glycaniphila TaxID=1679444 RepID=UPI001C016CD5|nr:hypothetical protein [Akkermansia glycaniphila]MBT9449995.1 hypothetical protein [Akkermansia glycaniphila]